MGAVHSEKRDMHQCLITPLISTYLLALAHALRDPCLNLRPGLVDRKKASLSSALDQLVGLHDKRRAREPRVVLLDFDEAAFSAPLEHFSLNLSGGKARNADSGELIGTDKSPVSNKPVHTAGTRARTQRNRTNDDMDV